MLDLIAVLVYLAVLVAVGFVKSKSVRGQEGFSLANRGLSLPILLGTLLATWTGTGSIFGQAEEAYNVGLPALILPFGPVLGFLVLMLLAARVRRRGRYTLQDILEERFGPVARVLGTVTLVTAYIVIVSYQFRAATVLLDRVALEAGLVSDPAAAHAFTLPAVALLVGLYTALAGMASVSLTDTFNGVLMTVGLLLALPMVWSRGGGAAAVVAALPEAGRHAGGHYGAFDIVSLVLPSFLLLIGDANMHARFLSARSDRAARSAAALLIPAVLFIDGAIILLAIGGRALLPGLSEPAHVVLELGLTRLPAAMGALIVATILAIIVSTADSYLLTSASALLRDVYQRFLRPQASEAELLRMARWLVMALTLVGMALGFSGEGFFDIARFAYTIYGVGITPVLLAALFWKRATPAGAVASMISAGTTAIVWKTCSLGTWAVTKLGLPPGSRVDAVVPAVLVAVLVLVGVSLLTRPRAPTLPRVPPCPA